MNTRFDDDQVYAWLDACRKAKRGISVLYLDEDAMTEIALGDVAKFSIWKKQLQANDPVVKTQFSDYIKTHPEIGIAKNNLASFSIQFDKYSDDPKVAKVALESYLTNDCIQSLPDKSPDFFDRPKSFFWFSKNKTITEEISDYLAREFLKSEKFYVHFVKTLSKRHDMGDDKVLEKNIREKLSRDLNITDDVIIKLQKKFSTTFGKFGNSEITKLATEMRDDFVEKKIAILMHSVDRHAEREKKLGVTRLKPSRPSS